MNNEPNYFGGSIDVPLEFYDSSQSTWIELYVAKDDPRPIGEQEVVHAIAGIIQMFRHPGVDLHQYIQFLPDAKRIFDEVVNPTITANPDNGPDFERVYDDSDAIRESDAERIARKAMPVSEGDFMSQEEAEQRFGDPLAALGL